MGPRPRFNAPSAADDPGVSSHASCVFWAARRIRSRTVSPHIAGGFFLRQARTRAVAAAALKPAEDQVAESLLAIILSALCLEAFANETGENVLAASELKDFLMCRRKFKKRGGLGTVSWKLVNVFERKWSFAWLPEDPLLKDVESLFELRNALVHYKLGESAAKTFLPPPTRLTNQETGEVMISFDFMQAPTHVEAPLVSRLNAATAARSYNTAARVLRLWNEKAHAPAGKLSAHQDLPEASET